MSVKAETTFSLKDSLYKRAKVEKIAHEIKEVHSDFKVNQFVNVVTAEFPKLELMERLDWIRSCLHDFLPADYQTAVNILLDSLPEPLDPDLSDDDFGDFIYGPYGAFVAEYGCDIMDVDFSLCALKEMTKRFSVEFPIRTFLNQYPQETLDALDGWKSDENYHVRRLVSEGTRPFLPWAKKVSIDYRKPLIFLDALHSDQTRYVTRSAANHLNDISKIDPELVIETLTRWLKNKKQSPKELDFIVKHSLRTLEKNGHQGALLMLGYSGDKFEVSDLKLKTKNVKIGSAVEFQFSVTSTAEHEQSLLLDYNLYFKKANGSQTAKTFKIAKTQIGPREVKTFQKKQLLRPMTTRVLYPGEHKIELQINGKKFPQQIFLLDV